MADRKALFIRHYKIDPDATAAARAAGYAPRSAARAGARLLNDPVVKAALAGNGEGNGEPFEGKGKNKEQGGTFRGEGQGKDQGGTFVGEGNGNFKGVGGGKQGECDGEGGRLPLFALVDSAEAVASEGCEDGPVSVDWVVKEAKRTYDAAHEAGSLSTAVSCLNLIGKHLEGKAEATEAGFCGVTVVTGVEGAPGEHL